MNKTILNIYSGSSVIKFTEDPNCSPVLNEGASVNDAATVIGPDGKEYHMSMIQDYVEASVDFIKRSCPYLVVYFNKLIRCFTFSVPTMATDGVYIFINPGFVMTLIEKCNGLDGVMFVLIHEVYHNLFSHFERVRAQPDVFNPYDSDIANAAEDYEINWIITQTIEDPREMSEYDPNDPTDKPPFELDDNGNPTDERRLPYKDIIARIGGLLREDFGGWTAERIYRYLLEHKNELPQVQRPKKVTIDKTTHPQGSPQDSSVGDNSPDEVEWNLCDEEREGYEAGWAQAIADMRAQGLIESFCVSDKTFRRIFESVSTGNAEYDRGYENGYASCIKKVQDMIKNGMNPGSGKSPKITGIPPECEMPRIKETQPTVNQVSGREGSDEKDPKTGQSSETNRPDSKTSSSGSSTTGLSVQEIVDKIDKLAKEHPVPAIDDKSGNPAVGSETGSDKDNRTGSGNDQDDDRGGAAAKPDGEYVGDDKFGVGQHTISKEEGAEIAKNAGVNIEDILKTGGNVESVFDDEGRVMKTLNEINRILKSKLAIKNRTKKQDSNNPGNGITDIIGVLSDIRTITIDWREALEDYFSGRIRMQNIGYNNNYIWDERYVDVYDYDEPDALDKVVIFLDTSGSMMGDSDDVAKCIHNIKQIIRDTDALSADLFLFSDGIYYGAPLDVNNISDNYDNYNINLPIRSGGTTYQEIFATVQKKYLDEGTTPDCIIIMTDGDLYHSIDSLPKNFACADDTLFMVVSNLEPKKLPFGSAVYVKPGDFQRVARKTTLNESVKISNGVIPKHRPPLIDEAFKMPVKHRVSQVDLDSPDTAVQQKSSDVFAKQISQTIKDALHSDGESWANRIDDVISAIRDFPELYVLFNKKQSLYKPYITVCDETTYIETPPQKGNEYLTIVVRDSGDIQIYGNVTLIGDNRINLWERLFARVEEVSDNIITLTDIVGNMSIVGCKITTLPVYMPKVIRGNFSLLRLPELVSLGKLPKYNYINIDNCPKLTEEELDRAGVIEESAKPRGRGMSAIIESRLALAEKFNRLNESVTIHVVNEDFRSTTFANMFNRKEGSQRHGGRTLTYTSLKNREILNKVESTSDFPVMWSEITDDMITVTHPNDNTKSKATYERRDQNKTDDWGIRIACDEDGQIIFIITGDNRAKENKKRKSGAEPYRLYDWIDKGWLYIDEDIVNLINLRIDLLKYAKLGFSIYLNAYFKLGIMSDVNSDFMREDSKLLDMLYIMRKVNFQDTENLPERYKNIRDIWIAVKNSELYVDLSDAKIQDMIHNYYVKTLGANSGYVLELDQAIANAIPAIEEFKIIGLDYAKQNLMRLTEKVKIVKDNTPMGYHVFGMTFPDFELVIDRVDTLYDIDSKHNSRASRTSGDDRAELGEINPYDKDILKYGRFDVRKNRETDDIERSKFGILNNSRKRKLIQNVRDNAITGTNYSLKQLNDPVLKRKEAEGKLFTPNTEAQTREAFGGITDMIRGVNAKFEKTTVAFERLYPEVAQYDTYNKVQKHYDRIKRTVDMFADAGNNLIKQAKVADAILMKIDPGVLGRRKLGVGYRDTVSGQVAAAVERMNSGEHREVSDIYDITDPGYGILPAINRINTVDIAAVMKKDWEDIKKKYTGRYTDWDDEKTRHSMAIRQQSYDNLRNSSVEDLTRCVSILTTGYVFLINDMTALRASLRTLGKSK